MTDVSTGVDEADERFVLMRTKVSVPVVRGQQVLRPRLVEALGDGLSAKLTLVCAPTGWGKTSLLAEWAQATTDARFAWVSPDAVCVDCVGGESIDPCQQRGRLPRGVELELALVRAGVARALGRLDEVEEWLGRAEAAAADAPARGLGSTIASGVALAKPTSACQIAPSASTRSTRWLRDRGAPGRVTTRTRPSIGSTFAPRASSAALSNRFISKQYPPRRWPTILRNRASSSSSTGTPVYGSRFSNGIEQMCARCTCARLGRSCRPTRSRYASRSNTTAHCSGGPYSDG